MKLEPAIIWKLVTLQRITSKRYSTSMGRHLSPRYGQVILVSGYPVLTAVNWLQHLCAIWIQYQVVPRLANQLESLGLNTGFPELWTDGRSVHGHAIPKLLGWVDYASYGAPHASASRAWSSVIMQSFYNKTLTGTNCSLFWFYSLSAVHNKERTC